MILKEAFRMQNQLSNLIEQADMFLAEPGNITKTTEKHNRKKANPAAEDEEIVVQREDTYEPGIMIDLVMDLIAEKEKLSKEISVAKRAYEDDIDTALAINKEKQRITRLFSRMAGIKATEKKRTGRDFMINGEGNQTPYSYPVDVVTVIDFDRDKVRGIAKRLQAETDLVSNGIDKANLTIEVSYHPKYEIGCTLEEAYEQFQG